MDTASDTSTAVKPPREYRMIKLIGTAKEKAQKMAEITSMIKGKTGERDILSDIAEEHLRRTRYKPQRNTDETLEVILDAIDETPSAPAPTVAAWTQHFMRLAKMEKLKETFMSNLLIELYSNSYADYKREAAIEVSCTLPLFR